MDLSLCSECEKPLGDDTVWYRPFAAVQRLDAHTLETFAVASTEPDPEGQSIPFHPACFEQRYGEKRLPPSK